MIRAVDVSTYEEVNEITETNHHARCKNCWPELKARRSTRTEDLRLRRMPEEVRQHHTEQAGPAVVQVGAGDSACDIIEDMHESSVNSSDESSSSEEPAGDNFDGVANTEDVQKKLDELDADYKINEERSRQGLGPHDPMEEKIVKRQKSQWEAIKYLDDVSMVSDSEDDDREIDAEMIAAKALAGAEPSPYGKYSKGQRLLDPIGGSSSSSSLAGEIGQTKSGRNQETGNEEIVTEEMIAQWKSEALLAQWKAEGIIPGDEEAHEQGAAAGHGVEGIQSAVANPKKGSAADDPWDFIEDVENWESLGR